MIYFDNSATSFPKAPGIAQGVQQFISESCFNVGRGAYSAAFANEQMIFETKRMLSDMLGCANAKHIIFTGGATQSINTSLSGLLKDGDTVVSSTMEHNAVLRPLIFLQKKGVNISLVDCNENGEIDMESLSELLSKRPKMLILTHASNLCGTIMPIRKIGGLCKKYGVLFVVDASQTAGLIDINLQRDNIDVLCFPAHKGLLALQGLGGIALSETAASQIEPLIFGGTGSFSESLDMPNLLPDRLEAGTQNIVGVFALKIALEYIKEVGIENIFAAEKSLQNYFEEGLQEFNNLKIVGGGAENRCAVTAVDFLTTDNSSASYLLDSEFGIMTRSGLHCAPIAHKTLGTFPNGVVRFSFGHKNTKQEIDILFNALKKILPD